MNMKIILKNGKEVGIEEIPYITDEGKFIIGKNEVEYYDLLGKIVNQNENLWFVNYSNLYFIAIEDSSNDMLFKYVIEQELKNNNKISIKNNKNFAMQSFYYDLHIIYAYDFSTHQNKSGAILSNSSKELQPFCPFLFRFAKAYLQGG